jgi:hypothetical protein
MKWLMHEAAHSHLERRLIRQGSVLVLSSPICLQGVMLNQAQEQNFSYFIIEKEIITFVNVQCGEELYFHRLAQSRRASYGVPDSRLL